MFTFVFFFIKQNYEKEVRARCGPVHKDLHQLFGDLRDSDPSDEGLSTASPMVVDAKPVEKPSKVLPPKTKSPALKILKRNSLKAKGWEKMKVTKALKVIIITQLVYNSLLQFDWSRATSKWHLYFSKTKQGF